MTHLEQELADARSDIQHHHHEYKNGYADGIKAAQAAANGDTDE